MRCSEQQVSEAPHLFEFNAGGGAVGNTPGGDASARANVKKPICKETCNTKWQLRLQKCDPDLVAWFRAIV